jgi:hypothetical protein
MHRLNDPDELAATLGENVGAPIDRADWHWNRWENVGVGWQVQHDGRYIWTVCGFGGTADDMTVDLRREADGEVIRQYAFHVKSFARVECRQRGISLTDSRWW